MQKRLAFRPSKRLRKNGWPRRLKPTELPKKPKQLAFRPSKRQKQQELRKKLVSKPIKRPKKNA